MYPIESLVLIVQFTLLLFFLHWDATRTTIPATFHLPLPFFLREGSGVKTDASTALGMTDTTSGIKLALRTVFSLLAQAANECHDRRECHHLHLLTSLLCVSESNIHWHCRTFKAHPMIPLHMLATY